AEDGIRDLIVTGFRRVLFRSKLSDRFYALPPNSSERTQLYFNQLLPLFKDIKREADLVLDLNQRNMETENKRALEAASWSIRLRSEERRVGKEGRSRWGKGQ